MEGGVKIVMEGGVKIVNVLCCCVMLTGCTSGSESDCEPNPEDPSAFVIVGFWDEDDSCSGEPMITNAFPVDNSAACYCWPGNSGSNSADDFECQPSNNSFSYTQYNSLTCGEGDNTPVSKTVYTDACEQDIPANLYAKIVDYGACAGVD